MIYGIINYKNIFTNKKKIMKKLLLSLLFVTATTAVVNAQEIGQMWVGGSLAFSSSKTDDLDRANSYKIIPEFGYVLTNDFAIGVKLGYQHTEYSDVYDEQDTYVEKSNGFSINPFVRYTYLKGDIGGLFIDGGVGYSHFKTKSTPYNAERKRNAFDVGFRPGVALALSERIVLTGRFGFLGYEYSKAGDIKSDKFSFDLHMDQIELGVNIVF